MVYPLTRLSPNASFFLAVLAVFYCSRWGFINGFFFLKMWSMDTGRSQKQFVSSAVPVIHPQTKKYLGISIVTTTLKDVHHYLSTIDLLGGYLYFFRYKALSFTFLCSVYISHDLVCLYAIVSLKRRPGCLFTE